MNCTFSYVSWDFSASWLSSSLTTQYTLVHCRTLVWLFRSQILAQDSFSQLSWILQRTNHTALSFIHQQHCHFMYCALFQCGFVMLQFSCSRSLYLSSTKCIKMSLASKRLNVRITLCQRPFRENMAMIAFGAATSHSKLLLYLY